MVPKVMSNKVEGWKAWSTDLMEHVDSTTPGMNEFLEQLGKLDDEPSPSFLQFYSGKIDVELERVKMYRTLKKLTDGEAKKVVVAVKGEDGLEAWQRLVNNFEPTLAGRQGRALNELTDMIKKPAKTTEDTRHMIVELMEKIRIAEELAAVAFADIGNLLGWGKDGLTVKRIGQLSPVQRRALSAVTITRSAAGATVRLVMHDKLAALEKLCRMFGLYEPAAAKKGAADAAAAMSDVERAQRLAAILRLADKTKAEDGAADG